MVKKLLGMLVAFGLLVSPVMATQNKTAEVTNATPEKKVTKPEKKKAKKTTKKAPKKPVNATEEKKAQ